MVVFGTARRSPFARHVSLMSSEEDVIASSVDVLADADVDSKETVNEEEKVSDPLSSSPETEPYFVKDDDDAVVVAPPPVKHTVYVGNLPFSTTREEITNLFTEKGIVVVNLAMPMNPNMIDEYTGEPKNKGYCFVDVESEPMIVTAVESLKNIELDGRPIRINKLLPKEEVAKSREKNFTPSGKKKLYVGNLPFLTNEDEINAVFSEYGDVSDIYLPMRDGKPRGFCFVTMDVENADEAMADLNGSNFQGRNLVVNEPLKKGEKPPPRKPQFKLYVGNLSFYTTQDTLFDVFSEFGTVHDCYLPTDPNTDQPRGFGFITMDRADGEAAIEELDGLELDGRFIRVNEAQGKRRSSPPPPSSFDDDYDGGDDEGGFY